MPRPRDNQRGKVYAWERAAVCDFHNGPERTLAECKTMIDRVWADYRPKYGAPTVKDGRGCTLARGGRLYITLPRWARRVPIVLHELAHSLLPTGAEAHGPEFVRLFIDLLIRYYEPGPCKHSPTCEPFSKGKLLQTARLARIRVGQAQAALKPTGRRSKRPIFETRPCRPHDWNQGRLVDKALGRCGYVLVFEAVCRTCGRVRSPVTPDALAALKKVMAKLNDNERRTLEQAIIAHLQDAAREGFNAHEVYLDSLVDVNPAVGDAEELTLRDCLRMLRKGYY